MLLVIIVFCSVFAVAALLIAASGTGASEQLKQTLMRLDALLVTGREGKDELVDLEKKELMSSIPMLNQILLRVEIAPQLRKLLYQANVKWTPGGFLLLSFSAWMVSSYVLYLRTEMVVFS